MATIAMQAGTYHTKSTKAWAAEAARLPAIAAAHTRNRTGIDGHMPPNAPRDTQDDSRQHQGKADKPVFHGNLQIAVFGVA